MIGAATWVIATRNITTSTSLEQISATTNIAHLLIHPLVASHDEPDRARGANTIATSSSALRTSSESHTIAAEVIASPARKIVMIAPTPGAAMLIAVSPPARIVIFSPIDSVVSPAAWTIPTHSWSTTSNSSPVRVITTNDPNTLLARPRAARVRAVGSRLMRPVMSWRQKNSSITNTAMPNSRLYTDRYPSLVMSTRVVASKTFHTASNNQPAAEPMAWASQSNGADTSEAAASPAVSQTPEMTGRSQIPTAITPHTRGLERLGRG